MRHNPEAWQRVKPGHYRHPETGIEIIKEGAYREPGYRAGVRWNITVPQPGSARDIYGSAGTLKDAKAWAATGEDSFVEKMRAVIAEAWREAHAEWVRRDRHRKTERAATPREPLRAAVAAEVRAAYLAKFPTPRAGRLDTAVSVFTGLSDTAGPGTARGLIAAVENASTVTPEQFAWAHKVALATVDRLAGRVHAHDGAVASALSAALADAMRAAGLAVDPRC